MRVVGANVLLEVHHDDKTTKSGLFLQQNYTGVVKATVIQLGSESFDFEVEVGDVVIIKGDHNTPSQLIIPHKDILFIQS